MCICVEHACPLFAVVLAKRHGNVVLTCSTTPDRNVFWKLKGRALEDELFQVNFRLDGQLLNLSGVEELMLGEYSCWSEEQMLSSVYLLFEDEKSGEVLFLLFVCCCCCFIILFPFISQTDEYWSLRDLSLVSLFPGNIQEVNTSFSMVFVDSTFRCWAKSYNCSFNCEWTDRGEYTEARVGLGKDW